MVRRPWLVMIAVTAIFFFASATTFQSMGIVVFAMQGDFHWTEAEAGGAFMALVLVCAVASLFPVSIIPRFGARRTIIAGGIVLAGAFLLASSTRTLLTMYAAAGLSGLGFAFVANACGIFLIASWFGPRAPRMIGFYLMCGTLGGAVGPPVAEAIVSSDGGWRLHWQLMSVLALLLAALCAFFIKDPPETAHSPALTDGEADAWTFRGTLTRPQFLVIASAMVATQACVVTVSSVTASHFAHIGWPSDFAARILALQGLIGAVASAFSGWISERWDARSILATGLLGEMVGMILLGSAHQTWMSYAFTPAFGIGWAAVSLATTVLLIQYFGNKRGMAGLSAIWMLCGAAAAGPPLAGLVADLTGSFAPALDVLGLLLLPSVVGTLMMTAPRRAIVEPAE